MLSLLLLKNYSLHYTMYIAYALYIRISLCLLFADDWNIQNFTI